MSCLPYSIATRAVLSLRPTTTLKLLDLGVKDTSLQDKHSISSRETLRNLHYQLQHAQAKLCRVIEDEAYVQQQFLPRYSPQ
jgi:dTDP-4-dehydrorhamnose 3,5-epimerase-like enzyme